MFQDKLIQRISPYLKQAPGAIRVKTIHGRRYENLLKLMDDLTQWIP
ncbi:hypothetical protein [Fictibacillus enclensis]